MQRFFTTELIGWLVSLPGAAIWLYGYFAEGTAPFVDWRALFPEWFAEFLPNFESEVGFALMILGSVLIYWPKRAYRPDTESQ